MPKKALALLVFAIIVISPSLAAAQEYPTLYYYVNDYADALYSFQEEDLEMVCMYVYDMTGAQMAVVIVNSTYPDDINTYAYETFEKNELGQEDKDNGLLLVLATDDQQWKIEVGYGLEGILPDARVGNISETYLLPEIQQWGDYYAGINATLYELGNIILTEYEEAEPPESPYPISFIPLTAPQLVIAIIVTVVLAVVTKGRIIWFIPWIFSGGKIGGGGLSGGGGAGGRW